MKQKIVLTPVEKALRRRRWCILVFLLAAFSLSGIYLYHKFHPNKPVDYSDIREHFKYGSIGTEPVNGLPYWIWKVLPVLFADKLPEQGYASFGLLYEEGADRPVGFSKRKVIFDRVWFNCSVCHTSTVRETPESKRELVLGMPANRLDLESLFMFLIDCAKDQRFTSTRIMAELDKMGAELNFVEKLLYRFVIVGQVRDAFLRLGNQIDFIARQASSWGPGRVDTFNPYKVIQFNFQMNKLPDKEIMGITDLPSIWLQKPREGMHLHWDGNNTSVEERNKSAALGAGVTPTTIDLPRIKRIEDWLLEFEPPEYPFEINDAMAARGADIYRKNCSECHGKSGRDFSGEYVGTVEPIENIGTDPYRLNSFTYEFVSNQNTLYSGYPYRFTHFRKTDGYANMPLDGIWLRAPYLHNGSVPTLRDLLNKPEERPLMFYRGYDVYDKANVGFVSDVAVENGHEYFKYDTTLPSNFNTGHMYGIDLSHDEKEALVEYLKTF